MMGMTKVSKDSMKAVLQAMVEELDGLANHVDEPQQCNLNSFPGGIAMFHLLGINRF